MPETTCPICLIPLINGTCPECGYTVDNYVLPNQTREFYTEDYGNSNNYRPTSAPTSIQQKPTYRQAPPIHTQQPAYRQYRTDNTNKPTNSNSDSKLKVAALIMAFLFPVVGIILSVLLIKKEDPTYKNSGKIALVISIVVMTLSFFINYV